MEFTVNYFGVVGAAVAAFIVSWIWYSPVVFGNLWMKLTGKRDMKPSKDEMMRAMVAGIASFIIMAFVLDLAIQTAGKASPLWMSMRGALSVAFAIWVGFVAMIELSPVIWEKRSIALFFLAAGADLVSMLTMAVVLFWWM